MYHPSCSYRIINFGTEIEKYTKPRKPRSPVPTIPTIISLRAHKPLYDIETLIKALPLVASKHPIKAIIAGDGPLRNRHIQMAKTLCRDTCTSIEFPGNIPSNRIPETLARADIYVNTSTSDAGLAASTAEAMAAGLPVITTDIGDNPKWIQHGKTGLLYRARDRKDLAEQIKRLIENPKEAKKYGKHGQRIIQHRNNHKREMEKMEAEYLDRVEKKM